MKGGRQREKEKKRVQVGSERKDETVKGREKERRDTKEMKETIK